MGQEANDLPWADPVARAIVALVVRPAGGGVWVSSGFVVEVGSYWYWLTAAHVFDDLESVLVAHPGAAVTLWPFFDPERCGVRFAYKASDAARLDAEAEKALGGPVQDPPVAEVLQRLREQDIGIYALDAYYVRNLSGCGVVPLNERDTWRADADFQARWGRNEDIQYFLCGVPANEVEFAPDWSPTALSLRILPIFTKDLNRALPRFEPGWGPAVHQGSVKGMSGGPAIIVSGGRAFWFGIQSAQLGVEGKTPRELSVAVSWDLLPLLEAHSRYLSGS